MELTRKQLKWLELVAISSGTRNRSYPGQRADLMPARVLRFLESGDYVQRYIPHNIEHKERVVITELGRAALAKASPKEE